MLKSRHGTFEVLPSQEVRIAYIGFLTFPPNNGTMANLLILLGSLWCEIFCYSDLKMPQKEHQELNVNQLMTKSLVICKQL